ncbi:hypothetical protein EYZ11_008052 [Aspergillus tanneri]|uniref:Uncharacterized protein n=1 Tax=Aspergillus tanneri TaxID=1220188 RepID=A0A4S3JDP0_9EURO|nr:hypothetical protein EYZ11_008052 [Aspergillus tanneri]
MTGKASAVPDTSNPASPSNKTSLVHYREREFDIVESQTVARGAWSEAN